MRSVEHETIEFACYQDTLTNNNNIISHYCIFQQHANMECSSIDQFRYIKIQPKTIDLSTRLLGITAEFVGFIPQSLVGKLVSW